MKSLQSNNCCRARGSRRFVNQKNAYWKRTIARRTIRRQLEQKASAAAEVMLSSRTPSVGGLLFDASFLFVHAPWKILIPHNTTTMADTSVAAVNTLSMEATLILLSASQPHQRSR
jgi:hypothetical protein